MLWSFWLIKKASCSFLIKGPLNLKCSSVNKSWSTGICSFSVGICWPCKWKGLYILYLHCSSSLENTTFFAFRPVYITPHFSSSFRFRVVQVVTGSHLAVWPGKYRMYLLSTRDRYLMVSTRHKTILFSNTKTPVSHLDVVSVLSHYRLLCWSCRPPSVCLRACSGWGLLHTSCCTESVWVWETTKHSDLSVVWLPERTGNKLLHPHL